MSDGGPERQRNAELLYNRNKRRSSNTMEAVYQASQGGTPGTATASVYGYQMVVSPRTYASLNPGSINNSIAETSGYQNQTMSNSAVKAGLHNSSPYQFSSRLSPTNPATQQANYMATNQRNLIANQGNSMGYQENPARHPENPAEYQRSYNNPAAVADQFAYPYNNPYYDYTAMQAYQHQQSKWHTRELKKNNAANKKAPKASQFHYCEVCKISCSTSNAYREHLEGQKHKKKEILSKIKVSENSANLNKNLVQCKLCNVYCSNSDSYNSHIRGAQHKKVVLLHTQLGKEIPTEEPVLINGNDESETDIQQVGQEFLEEIKNEAGTIVNFKCKLCDCQISKTSQDLHLKGRRHRLLYKKEVDPNLLADIKPTLQEKKIE